METEPQIRRDWVETGRLKLTFRPILDFGPSLRTTEAAYCAGDQGKFWDMHDRLFAGQGDLFGANLAETLRGYAEDVGLDLEDYDRCMDSAQHAQTIQQQHADARAQGVRIRPTFRLGERRIEGALPYNQFQTILSEVVP